jgi:AcrR family transcriptional regulator
MAQLSRPIRVNDSPSRRYASLAMSERRQRIIERAHAILGEGGVQALTIARLSREAGVAPRTIYRLFNDKDGVVLATVSDRLHEVREAIVVIAFFFSTEPHVAAIRELRSVAYNRFRNWLDVEVERGNCYQKIDLERVAQEHVASEFYVYHRWAIGTIDDRICALELRCSFLKTALLVLNEPVRGLYFELLVRHQRELGPADPVEFIPGDGMGPLKGSA